jgi:hypothetical protein
MEGAIVGRAYLGKKASLDCKTSPIMEINNIDNIDNYPA